MRIKPTEKCMDESEDELLRNDNEVKRPLKVKARDIRRRVAQVNTYSY
jgi:hypothetical protein